MGPLIDLQHILHIRYERRVLLRRDHPVLLNMGFEFVFFKARAIVLGLAAGTMSSSTTLPANNFNVQRAWPSGASEQANIVSFASVAPSKILGTGGVARCLRLRTASNPSSTSCWRTR